MTISLNILLVICFATTLIITAMTLIAVKWGYSVNHTIDDVMKEPTSSDEGR